MRMRSTENSKRKLRTRSCVPWRSEIFFRTRSVLRSRILRERQRNANWNTPRTRSVLIFLLGYFCPVLYAVLNASVILERNEKRLERNEICLARNETRGGNLLLSGTVHFKTNWY